MKNILHFLCSVVLFFSYASLLNAQSVTISDSSGCFGGFTVTFAGTFNGKNYYNNIGQGLSLYWDAGQSRWEVDGGSASPGVEGFVVWINSADSSPNPPNLTLGTWADASGFCGVLIQMDGNGTQSSLSLPVELTYFGGKRSAKNVLLNWQTATETNNEGFDIQHSTNGRDWTSIGWQAGAGSSLEKQDYTFLHEKAVSGTNYYRLKQIDFDGQFDYSDIAAIELIGADMDLSLIHI